MGNAASAAPSSRRFMPQVHTEEGCYAGAADMRQRRPTTNSGAAMV
jgi:hypothetical protein